MNRQLAALLLGAGVFASAAALAQEPVREPGEKLVNAQWHHELETGRRAQPLRASAGADPDTVWFGYSRTDHWNASTNYWNLWTGVNRPTQTPNAANALWDWDGLGILAGHGVGDSLCGWWPVRRAYTLTGGMTLPDASRPWWAIDIGNAANSIMNAGPGGKRTKGVVGVWHGDAGANEPGGSAVQWTPLSGARSAWCGLRQLNDVSVVDAVTHNPFNQAALDFVGETTPTMPSAKRFPGYASQWDQMLYRDLAAAPATALDISFLYRTRMSASVPTTPATRTGWFHGDPLAVVAGNFISSTAAGAGAPTDSLLVYAGAPVNDAACVYSDGEVRAVYDPQRRWFSEVLRIFEGPSVPYHRLFAATGCQPADTLGATPMAGVTLPAAYVDAIRNAPGNAGHLVRLVFRVKTNRGFADDDGLFDSATRGAAIVDDVTVNGSVIGDFELPEQGGPNAIDNRTGTSALNHWKSTGKPPSIYFHLENIEDGAVVYNDLCGAWNSPARLANLSGNVMVAGNHDDFEKHGDSRFAADREVLHGMWSPTVNLVVDRSGANTPNAMGLTASIVDASDDYYLGYDFYAGMFNLQFTGNAWTFGAQVYPCTQLNNGAAVWGDPEYAAFEMFNPEPQALADFEGLHAAGVIVAETPSGVPDSLRVFLGTSSQCFRFGVTLGCNSADGGYFDNVSLGFVDRPAAAQAGGAGAAGVLTLSQPGADPWEWFQDTFPANETPGLPNSANFDTAAALIKGGRNIAPSTGNALRFDVLADTILLRAPDATGSTDPVAGNRVRVDLVFRILPGPGNYAIASPGGRTFPPTASMRLLRVPTDQAAFATAGDGSFWGTYLANPGPFAKGTHNGGTSWDHLTWNSARCDTSEQNRFPVASKWGAVITSADGNWASMLHESDPNFNALGITKFRCFLVDTTLAGTQLNVVCDGTVPAYLGIVPQTRTGYDGVSTTKEYTKVIPDGLLTPGAHVQYFWRSSPLADSARYVMVPDTNLVYQVAGEGSVDGHRWQQFGVLPDRWKASEFGGSGMACMLYVDLNDRRGNERVFVSVADSICFTSPAKFGAHNGWHAPAIYAGTGADLADYPVHGKNQQPGTTWDMYGVKASESLTTGGGGLGGRLANRSSMGLLSGRYARSGPTPEMLRRFYSMVAIHSGDLNSGIFGPFMNRSQNDVALLNDYLTGNDVGSTPQPRGIYIGGDGFAQAETQAGGVDPAHMAFLTTKLGVTLRNGSYQSVSGNTNDCVDLVSTNIISVNSDVFGIGSSCGWSNDLLQRNPSVPEAVDATFYQAVGVGAPYTSSVYKPSNLTRNWVAYTEGWDIEHQWGRYCETTVGRLMYRYIAYSSLFYALCPAAFGQGPCAPLDVPQIAHGAPFANYLRVGESPMRGRASTVAFGVEAAQRVRVRLYDVSGRLVRTLVDRTFPAGEQSAVWDGADDAGRQVARGVYFARIDYATRGAALTGRVVVLR